MRNVWSIGILFWLMGAAHGAVEYTPLCSEYAQLAPGRLVRPQTAFLQAHQNSRYTTEVGEREIRNQCATSGCWAFQTVANLEREVEEARGKKARFSESWLMLNNVREKALRALETPREMVKGGNTVPGAYHLVKKYGLVPIEWKPRVDIFTPGTMDRLLGLVNQRLAQYHLAMLRTPEEATAHRTSAARDIEEILSVFVGPPPRLKVGGKIITPVEWTKTAVPEKKLLGVFPPKVPVPPELAPQVQITQKAKTQVHQARKEKEVEGEPLPEFDWTGRRTWEAIDKLIIYELEQGRTVPLNYEVATEYIDNPTGIMSIAAFPAPKGMEQPLSLPAREAMGLTGGSHAVEIVGVEVRDGEILRLKIRNSYGDKTGDTGHFHMYRDYFREYMKHIAVRREELPK